MSRGNRHLSNPQKAIQVKKFVFLWVFWHMTTSAKYNGIAFHVITSKIIFYYVFWFSNFTSCLHSVLRRYVLFCAGVMFLSSLVKLQRSGMDSRAFLCAPQRFDEDMT